jgi:thiol-disulfide isomerase/thioredoxin
MPWAVRVRHVIFIMVGSLLLLAAALKGHQLLTEPLAKNDIWSYRPFLVLQVEFELLLGLWLLSGVFVKAAWLTSFLCFCLFSLVTLYKGLMGAGSCGCFGSVHVNPWVTLLVIDLPTVVLLTLFRPDVSLQAPLAFLRRRQSIRDSILELLTPFPSLTRLVVTSLLAVVLLSITTPILALNQPPVITSTYEVLEPETWVGKELPILEHIDIAEQLSKGTWLVLFYHHDCPDCRRAIPQYEQMARDLAGSKDFLRIALIDVPPYGSVPRADSPCLLGRLADIKEWFITTPTVTFLVNAKVEAAWEAQAPSFEVIMGQLAGIREKSQRIQELSINISTSLRTPEKVGDAYDCAEVVEVTLTKNKDMRIMEILRWRLNVSTRLLCCCSAQVPYQSFAVTVPSVSSRST